MMTMAFVVGTALFLIRGADGSRRVSGAHLNASTGSPLRIFASTWNAGNADSMSAQDMTAALTTLVEGHGDADIVIVGLQEARENKYMDAAFQKLLFAEESRKQTASILQELGQLLEVPPEVVQGKQRLTEKFREFHSGLSSELERYKKAFGPESDVFTTHVAEHSQLLGTLRVAEPLRAESDTKIAQMLDTAQSSGSSDEVQFQQLRSATDALLSTASAHPTKDSCREDMAPIQAWRENSLQAFQEVVRKYPNLVYKSRSQDFLKVHEKKLGEHMRHIEGFLLTNHNIAKLHGDLDKIVRDAQESLEKKIDHNQKHWVKKVTEKWQEIQRNLQELKAMIGDSEIVETCKEKLSKDPLRSHGSFQEDVKRAQDYESMWNKGDTENLDYLVKTDTPYLHHEDVVVGSESTVFKAQWHCIGRGDCSMHVFVNPWSGWHIDSATTESTSFNIDQSVKNECGKAVNVRVLRATRGKDVLNICALNTHQSFARSAFDRMGNLEEAMMRLEDKGCNAVVFVGDFNTRLHCASPAQDYDGVPLFDQGGSEDDKDHAFTQIISQFCDGDVCTLMDKEGGPEGNGLIDEMNQFINEDKVRCYEETGKSKEKWELRVYANDLKRYGLREVDHPSFAPTYKLAEKKDNMKKYEKYGYKCLPEDEAQCLVNKSGKKSHNPAWTDRVIVKTTGARIRTTMYARRSQNLGVSDHANVAARLEVTADPRK